MYLSIYIKNVTLKFRLINQKVMYTVMYQSGSAAFKLYLRCFIWSVIVTVTTTGRSKDQTKYVSAFFKPF